MVEPLSATPAPGRRDGAPKVDRALALLGLALTLSELGERGADAAVDAVQAAGGVVWRRRRRRGRRCCSCTGPSTTTGRLPKGKLEPGETRRAGGRREVARGDRACAASSGPSWSSRTTSTARAGPKVVRYWVMTVASGAFAPNDEVDEVRWLARGRGGRAAHLRARPAVLDELRAEPLAPASADRGSLTPRSSVADRPPNVGVSFTSCSPRSTPAGHPAFLGWPRRHRDAAPCLTLKERTILTLTRRGTVVAAGRVHGPGPVRRRLRRAARKTTTGDDRHHRPAGPSFDYASLSGTLNGSGSTFQKTFDEAAIQGFSDVAPDVTVNYGGGGSGKGKTDLASQVVQWAGTDSTDQGRRPADVQGRHRPLLPDRGRADHRVLQPERRDRTCSSAADTLAKIFQAKITTWNDPAIAADNPGATLPSTPITVVHRSDGSGTTNQLHQLPHRWPAPSTWTLGAGDTVNWPTAHPGRQRQRRRGPGHHSSTDGAIGYVDFCRRQGRPT